METEMLASLTTKSTTEHYPKPP